MPGYHLIAELLENTHSGLKNYEKNVQSVLKYFVILKKPLGSEKEF